MPLLSLKMVDSLYYSSRKISERCENSFLDYRINCQKALLFNEANHERFKTDPLSLFYRKSISVLFIIKNNSHASINVEMSGLHDNEMNETFSFNYYVLTVVCVVNRRRGGPL